MLNDAQLEHRVKLENIYRSRITSLVTPIVGPGNVTTQVNIDIDFTKSEITEEIVDPDGTALRSEQSTLDLNNRFASKRHTGCCFKHCTNRGRIEPNASCR